MRIESLHLIAFASFTNTVIDLSQGKQGLHIIYGPNESGKSTSLRALQQVLYGIPAKTGDNFKHAHPDMRIGAILKHSDGRLLRLLRRKGNTKTLRKLDAENELVDQSLLQQFLGNVNQSTFENMFGIDHSALVNGGEAILKGNGELGQLLFSAGSGISDLRTVFAGLEKDYQEIYTRNGATRAINKQLSEFAEAKRRLKEAELPNTEWEQHDQLLRQAAQKKELIDARISQALKEKSGVKRFIDALPICAERELYFNQLIGLNDVIILPENFEESARRLLEQKSILLREEEHDNKKLVSLKAELDQLKIPEGVLERASTIESIQQKLGSYQKAAVDRLSLEQALIEEQERARACLRDLGRSNDFEAASNLRMSVQEKSRLRKLALERRALWQAFSDAQALRQRTEQRLRQCSLDLVQLDQMPACEKLLVCFKRIQQDPQVEERSIGEQNKLERSFKQLWFDLRKLQLKGLGDSSNLSVASELHQRLHSVVLPDMHVIEGFDKEWNQLNKEIEALTLRDSELSKELKSLQSRLQEHELKISVPTELDLSNARSVRDTGWKLVLKSWKNSEESPAGLSDYLECSNGSGDLRTAYEWALNKSDMVADRLRREADNVAQKVHLNAQVQNLESALLELKASLARKESSRQTLKNDWDALFFKLTERQLVPTSAKLFIAHFESHRTAMIQILENLDTITFNTNQISRSKSELREALSEAGWQVSDNNSSLLYLLDQAQQCLEKFRAVKQSQSDLEKELSRLQIDLSNNTVTEQTRKTELDTWAANWQPAVEELGLGATTSPEELTAFLDRLEQFFSYYDQIGNYQRRISGIDRDAEEFESDVKLTLSRLQAAGNLNLSANLEVEETATALLALLKKTNELSQRRRLLREQQRDLTEASESRLVLIQKLSDKAEQMVKEASVDSEEKLIEAAKRSQQRKNLSEIVDNYNRQLIRLAEGTPFEQFIGDCKQQQLDDLNSQLALIDESVKADDLQREELQTQIGAEKQILLGMNGSADAAESAVKVQQILAELGQDVEQYARLRVASIILQKSIDRYRQKNQSPILRAASEIFSNLSNRSFTGLQEDYNDRGEPVLFGVRSETNALIPIEGMSEGTCDQVYLALRLAGLLLYLEKEEPLPFIVDDILVNFDDERSLATLRVLTELSKRTQIIMFTHHAHIVELAQSHLDSTQVFVNKLSNASLTIPTQTLFAPIPSVNSLK